MAIPDLASTLGTNFDIPEAIDAENLGSTIRSTNLAPGAEPEQARFATATMNDDEQIDWRVRLSLPKNGAFTNPNPGKETRTVSQGGPAAPPPSARNNQDSTWPLAPLVATNGMVFPYTPNIFITYSANYDNLHPTHSNYPFPVYQNSAVDQFVITGEFTVENAKEGEYWIAANHYLRSVTKMAYGSGPNLGSPPPVVKLNGYGDFVFNDVPVVVQQYTVELGDAVDYIKVPVGQNGSWAPTRSTISVTLQPSYSRDSVNQFSLKNFVEGGYINNGPGFI